MNDINKNAPVKCRKTITINADVEKVWLILTNINDWMSWQTNVTYSKINGQLMAGTTFDWKAEGLKIRSTLHTVELHRYFGWTGKSIGMFAIHNWTLKSNGNKTEVIVEESMNGFLAKIFKKMLGRMLEKGMQLCLVQLKQKCEGL